MTRYDQPLILEQDQLTAARLAIIPQGPGLAAKTRIGWKALHLDRLPADLRLGAGNGLLEASLEQAQIPRGKRPQARTEFLQ